MKPKILVIVGSTATGKSDLAVTLARQFNGEIISADSRQVYKGLDIGSGKITKREMRGVPHYLLDVVSPKRVFSVADFKRLGLKAIDDIHARGKLPIIVGGTGFYIDALVYDMSIPAVPENKQLRKELSEKTAPELFALLETLDPERASDIDQHNKVRLIRAIEIAKTLGSIPKIKKEEPFDVCWVGLTWPDDVLKARIHTRLIARMKRGMVVEAKRLHTEGVSWKRMETLGLEYRYLALLLQNKLTRDTMLTELETKIWHYAKRQKTWFKRNKEIQWLVPTEIEKIQKIVSKWSMDRFA
jgi:tRNA dimethylallyltransferase